MRYFRYSNTNRVTGNAYKEQYKALTEDKRRIFRKEKCWKNLSAIVSFIVFFSCMIFGILLLKTIPLPRMGFFKLLAWIGMVVIGFVLLIASSTLTFFLTAPLWKKAESFHIPAMKKEILSKACEHLRDYYKLQEPYILTKCFDATDEKFRSHDLCIFVAGDELRITTDLVHGFLHGESDLGCYAFKREDITLSKKNDGKHLLAVLQADDTVFVLGYRAKGFIDKHFIAKAAA